MSKLKRQMLEDRALRDAARALIEGDVAHLRSDLSAKGIGERVIGSVGEGATDVFERATEAADNHRGVLAALIGAVVLWFARNPILELFSDEEDASQPSSDDGPNTPQNGTTHEQ